MSETPAKRPVEVIAQWLTPLRYSAGLAMLVLATFADVIVGDAAFVTKDFAQFGYGLANHHRESFWAGEIPLWNPLNECGIPFLAQWNTMVLYPGSLFYVLFPLDWSLSVFCVLHLYLGGLGAYALVRRSSGNNLAGTIAGMIFAFNGFMRACLMWPNNIAALGWMPWVFFTAICAWQSGGRKILIAALVGAMQMLTGAPEVILTTWIIVGGYWLWCLYQQRAVMAQVRNSIFRFTGLVGLVALLAAAQLLPFFDMFQHSARQAAEEVVDWPISIAAWIRFVMPLFQTQATSTGLFEHVDQGWIHSYYMGGLAVVMVAIAVTARRRPSTWLMAGVVIFSGLLAMGDNGFLYPMVAELLPLGFMRYPVKFLTFATALLPILAGLGVREVCAGNTVESRQRVLVGAMVGGVLVLMAFLLIGQYVHEHGDVGVARSNGIERLGLAVLLVGLLYGLVSCGELRVGRLLVGLLVFFLWLDYLRFQPGIALTRPRKNYTLVTPALEKVDQQFKEGKTRFGLLGVTQMENAFRRNATAEEIHMHSWLDQFVNLNLLNRVKKFDGFFALWFPEQDQLERVLHSWKRDDLRPGLADFLSIAYTTTPGQPLVWTRRPTALPLVTAGATPVFEDATNCVARLSRPEFDATKVVSLRPAAGDIVEAKEAVPATVEIDRVGAHELSFVVAASKPTLAVISQCFHHPWQAMRDGEAVPIWRANHAFQAVEVPSGTHRFTLRYVDWSFRIGAILSIGTLLAIGLLWWRWSPQSPATKSP